MVGGGLFFWEESGQLGSQAAAAGLARKLLSLLPSSLDQQLNVSSSTVFMPGYTRKVLSLLPWSLDRQLNVC